MSHSFDGLCRRHCRTTPSPSHGGCDAPWVVEVPEPHHRAAPHDKRTTRMGGPPALGRPAKPVICHRTTLPPEGQRIPATPPGVPCRCDQEVDRRRPFLLAISEGEQTTMQPLGDRCRPLPYEAARSNSADRSTPATVDGHHCRPPCAVGTRSAFSPSAIYRSVQPSPRPDTTRATTSSGSCRGLPRRVP
jgi:hypothetical protein